MAYDEELAHRIRELLSGEPDLTEQPMFGGLAFLVGGNLAVTASRTGGIMVRVDPDRTDRLLSTTPAHPMVMKGHPVDGWLRVDAEHVRTRRQLSTWVARGSTYARSLPAKPKRGRGRT